MAAAPCSAPIGVFDSGLGGMTVVRQMMRHLPAESILFVADQAHVPYGGRDLAEVRGFASGISAGLLGAGCKAIVMACNISSATALQAVRDTHPDTLVLGVIEPGAQAASQVTSNGRIGVLATSGTVRSEAYTRTFTALNLGLTIHEVACPAFVPLVEAGNLETPPAFEAARTYLTPLLEAAVDTIVLGCTHYPFLLPTLQQIAPHIRFVDPAEQTVLELASRLPVCTKSPAEPMDARHLLTTTGEETLFRSQLEFFLAEAVSSVELRSAHWNSGRLEIAGSG